MRDLAAPNLVRSYVHDVETNKATVADYRQVDDIAHFITHNDLESAKALNSAIMIVQRLLLSVRASS